MPCWNCRKLRWCRKAKQAAPPPKPKAPPLEVRIAEQVRIKEK